MSLTLIGQLLDAFVHLPSGVQIVIAVLIFVLIMTVLANTKVCDHFVRVIAAIRGEQTPKK